MVTAVKIVGILIICVLLIIFGPLLSIWALNTLFPVLAIPYTVKTWLAVILVAGLFKSDFPTKK